MLGSTEKQGAEEIHSLPLGSSLYEKELTDFSLKFRIAVDPILAEFISKGIPFDGLTIITPYCRVTLEEEK